MLTLVWGMALLAFFRINRSIADSLFGGAAASSVLAGIVLTITSVRTIAATTVVRNARKHWSTASALMKASLPEGETRFVEDCP